MSQWSHASYAASLLTSLSLAMARHAWSQPTTSAKPPIFHTQTSSQISKDHLERIRQRLAETSAEYTEWRDVNIAGAQPLFRPDVAGVAYYEVKLRTTSGSDAGYIISATGPHDYPIVEWATEGPTPLENVYASAPRGTSVTKAAILRRKVYRLDSATYVVENPGRPGEAWPLALPVRVTPSGFDNNRRRFDITAWQDWPTLKRNFAEANGTYLAALRSDAAQQWKIGALSESCEKWQTHMAGDWSEQRRYHQIAENTPPNTTNCESGCGATAWAMLFGWGDYRASTGDTTWAQSWGLYRDKGGTGADAVAPRNMDVGVSAMTWEIREKIKSHCIKGQGLTWPWDMSKAKKYLDGRTNASISVDYDPFFAPTLRDKADRIIRNGRPVIIALGWQHYPLAYGYRKKKCLFFDKHEFRINDGWGREQGRWVSAGTFFVGELHPASSAPKPRECRYDQKCCEPNPRGGCQLCVGDEMDCP